MLAPLARAAAFLLACAAAAALHAAPRLVDRGAARVTMVFDEGGAGDRGFNQAANDGLLRAARELGAVVAVVEAPSAQARAATLRRLVDEGNMLVVAVGFRFVPDVVRVAGERPAARLACVDCEAPAGGVPANALFIRFRDDEAGRLAGLAAGAATTTGTVGFLGGVDSGPIRRFLAGYRAGVESVRPGTRVKEVFVGEGQGAFSNPGRARTLADGLYGAGADVVFHAAGASGLGLFDSARAHRRWAIGVDVDQAAEAPQQVLCSVSKDLSAAVFGAVRDAVEGRFQGGERVLGRAEGGVGLAWGPAAPPATRARVEAALAAAAAPR
ncbi:MAG: BMP family ABC transporter substrate-binding protein [Deltaproteobacteria bacterium]|nr:BMP family ABC transporter substrate-binding protein [Deltaproteobacteria bacterium]